MRFLCEPCKGEISWRICDTPNLSATQLTDKIAAMGLTVRVLSILGWCVTLLVLPLLARLAWRRRRR